MARIYSVLQRQSDKRWDMTVSSDEEGWAHAIGYCAGWRGDPDEAEKERQDNMFGEGFSERLQADWEAKRQHQAKFHRDGHATSEEAYACYQQYELDNMLRFWESRSEQKKCQICETWTTHRAELGDFHREFILCPEHATREHVVTVKDKEDAESKAKRNVTR
jgi:hypothetical protein